MNLLRSLQEALANLRANKLRSILTMLGVIIGVSSVILLVSIIEGAKSKVFAEFDRLGSKLIIIVYNPYDREVRKSAARLDGMTMDDVRAIQSQCDLIQNVSAETSTGGGTQASFRDKETEIRSLGVQPDYSFLRDMSAARGRFLNEDDIDNWSKVCVVGTKVARGLYGNDDPLGREIDIDGVSLTVVGVLAPKEKTLGEDSGQAVLIPITTVQKRFVGRDEINTIYARPRPGVSVSAAMEQVWQTLMRRHNNAPGFRVDSQENILNAIGRIAAIFGLVVGSVAGLSLLVGGIGIMNIMLVSVTERTREIGIRKAVGARRKDILAQFLIESATVSGVGGLMGIGLGAGTAYAVSAISSRFIKGGEGPFGNGIPAHLPLWAVGGAFAFSAFVGVFFGIYPAIRAARLDPITALRHE